MIKLSQKINLQHFLNVQCFASYLWTCPKPSFGLSVKIWGQFSSLVCFNWVHNKIFTSFILEKPLWTCHKLHILIASQTRRTYASKKSFIEK